MEALEMFMSMRISSSSFPQSPEVYVWEGGKSHCISRYFWFLIGMVGRRGSG